MKISTYHRRQGDQVYLNGVGSFDKTYDHEDIEGMKGMVG